MTTSLNINEAKTHLCRLVDQAARGREVIIAKAGRSLVRLVPLEPEPKARTLGFLAGRGVISADLKRDFSADIGAMFDVAGVDSGPR